MTTIADKIDILETKLRNERKRLAAAQSHWAAVRSMNEIARLERAIREHQHAE